MTSIQTALHNFETLCERSDSVKVLISRHNVLADTSPANDNAVTIQDKASLEALIERLDRAIGSQKVRSAIDLATRTLSIGYQPEGVSGQIIYAPLVSMGASQANLPKNIVIYQDDIDAGDLSKLVAAIKRVPSPRRPNIIFVYNHQNTRGAEVFSRLANNVAVYELYGADLRLVEFPSEACDTREFATLAFYEAHASVARVAPFLKSSQSLDKLTSIKEYLRLRSQRITSTPTTVGKQLKTLTKLITDRASDTSAEDREFWATALVHHLLEFPYVYDAAPDAVIQAMSVADKLNYPELSYHTRKFANQIGGISNEAHASLNWALENYRSHSIENPLYRVSEFGCINNVLMTKAYRSANEIDEGWAREMLNYVLSEGAYYTNLGILASAVAITFLIKRRYDEALSLAQESLRMNADVIDDVNVMNNFLIIQAIAEGAVDRRIVGDLIFQTQQTTFDYTLKYHEARILGNLLKLPIDPDQRELVQEMTTSPANADFMSEYGNPNVAAAAQLASDYGFSKLPGPVGNIYRQHGLLLSCCFDWT